ncbi:MAG: 30S ribosome-binding factor RbfA [Candidatus Methylomirabilales bacterium]
MPPPFKRAERVADLLHRELSRLLLREIKDPRLREVTITTVRVSADLRHAWIAFTGGTPERAADQLRGLRSAAGFLRGQLGRALHLRYAPELSFEVDESVERTLTVMRLLREVRTEPDED